MQIVVVTLFFVVNRLVSLGLASVLEFVANINF